MSGGKSQGERVQDGHRKESHSSTLPCCKQKAAAAWERGNRQPVCFPTIPTRIPTFDCEWEERGHSLAKEINIFSPSLFFQLPMFGRKCRCSQMKPNEWWVFISSIKACWVWDGSSDIESVLVCSLQSFGNVITGTEGEDVGQGFVCSWEYGA